MPEEKTDIKYKLEFIGDVPEHLASELEPGDILIKATSLHNKFLEEPWQSKLAKDSRNNRLLWRHRDPEHPKWQGLVFGRNLQETVLDDGFSESYYRVFGGPEDSPYDKMQKLIKYRLELDEPIGISKGFIKHYDKNGEISRVIALEDSITYKPQCNQCLTQEVIIQMEEKEMKELVKKLQQELNDTKLQLEAKDKSIAEKDETLTKLEAERVVFKDKLDELEAKHTASRDEKSVLEEKFVELSDAFKKFKLESIKAVKTPLIDQILEFEDSSMKEVLRDIYLGMEITKLEERLTEVKSKENQAKIMVRDIEDDRKMAYEKFKGKTKDVGMSALAGLKKDDRDIAAQIEAEMKAEGIL